MGKAIVATRTEGLVGLGVIREGETGLLVGPGEIQGWRKAIERLIRQPELAIQMGRRACAVVEEGLNLDGYVQDMVDLVGRVATRPAEGMQTARRNVDLA